MFRHEQESAALVLRGVLPDSSLRGNGERAAVIIIWQHVRVSVIGGAKCSLKGKCNLAILSNIGDIP